MRRCTNNATGLLSAGLLMLGLADGAAAGEAPPDFMAPPPKSTSAASDAAKANPSSGKGTDEKKASPQAKHDEEESTAKAVFTKGIFPRPSRFGLLEPNLTMGLDGYKWSGDTPQPVDIEARVGLRLLLLPFGDTNFGVYFLTEFGLPFVDINNYLNELRDSVSNTQMVSEEVVNKSKMHSNHLDLSGGLHARFLAYGDGSLWRGIFGTLGYRGSVWGMQEHGIEATFGVELWRIRIGGTWYKSMSGAFKELGGQFFGARVEWRLMSVLPGSGL